MDDTDDEMTEEGKAVCGVVLNREVKYPFVFM